MVAQRVSPPRFKSPIVDAKGNASLWFRDLIEGLFARTGGAADKIDATAVVALAAAPQTRQIVGTGGLQDGGALGADFAITLYRARDQLSALPLTGNAEGDWAFALDEPKVGEAPGSETGAPVFWSQGQWNRVVGVATGGGSGGVGIVSANESASFTTVAAINCYFLDTAGGAYTVTMNASPALDELVEVWDSTGHAGTNPISFAGNGKNIAGSSTVASFVAINFGHARLIYDGTQWLMQ